jgi:cell wall-associated NlpC family hydrolase
MNSQESNGARLHISSVLDPEQETRTIRSHRKQADTRSRRFVAAVLVLCIAIDVVSVAESRRNTVSVPPLVTPASMQVTPLETPERVTMVSRSARQVSRKARIEKVIRYAMAQRGDRYRFGASGPTRWDCSGLVMRSFAQSGIKLPHQTGSIISRGKRVARSQLQRGDIVFPQRGHVGIYLGGGKMIHASSGKGKVIVAKVYGFYTARRVL